MLNVDTIKNGLVIDHICAGYGPKIFRWLGLENTNFPSALVMNVSSKTMGKKDIIKVDGLINIDYSVLLGAMGSQYIYKEYKNSND